MTYELLSQSRKLNKGEGANKSGEGGEGKKILKKNKRRTLRGPESTS